MKPAIGLHEARVAETAMSQFVLVRGFLGACERAEQIAALPTVNWKGRTLYTLRCQGTSGKGPHDTNVPESLLWALIDFRCYRCAFHANDSPAPSEPDLEQIIPQVCPQHGRYLIRCRRCSPAPSEDK